MPRSQNLAIIIPTMDDRENRLHEALHSLHSRHSYMDVHVRWLLFLLHIAN